MECNFVTRDTSQIERSVLKELAYANIPAMLLTLDTSHLDISPLKDSLPANKSPISVTRDTSHSAIGPYEPLEQSPSGDNLRHASIALVSSALDCGKNAEIGWVRGWVGRVGSVGRGVDKIVEANFNC